MKRIGKVASLVLGLTVSAGIAVGCTVGGKEEYDITKRVAMDENEISYAAEECETYFNYIEVYDDKGKIYQVGDPFVMRYNGKYYLYVSSTMGNLTNGIACWISENMIDWKFGAWIYGDGTDGSGGELTYTAYAPEVTFYNGYFYLCEAPAGQGHYIFRSTKPDGKFEVCSDNLGLGIDGSLYVDAEGNFYLLSAVPGNAAAGTICYTPLVVDNGWVTAGMKRVISTATLFGWTEGPGQFERNGYKYLTYTGNHVDSAAYRVGYAYTTENSLFSGLQTLENNLILLNTGDDTPYEGGGYASNESYAAVSTYRGLGHSSNVYGPNLDSVYIAYHNAGRGDHTGVSGSGFNRRYNITQLYTNGAYLTTNGLCNYDTPKPKGPDFSAYGKEELAAENGMHLSGGATQAVYTAEINLGLTDGAGSVVVSVSDAANYVEVAIEGARLTVNRYTNGTRTALATATVTESDFADAIHTVKVINGYASSEVWYDGVKEVRLSAALGGAGKVGVKSCAEAGSVQFTNDAFGTGDFESVKSLTAAFPAWQYLKTEHRGWQLANAQAKADGVRQGEKESTKQISGATATVLQAGDWVKYAVNAPKAGEYAFNVTVNKASAGCIFEVIVDDTNIYKMEIKDADFGDGEYLAVHAGKFKVERAGVHSMKVRVYSGTLDMTQISTQTGAESAAFQNTLTHSFEHGTVIMGKPQFGEEKGLTTRANDVRTMFYFGGKGAANVEIEADVSIASGTAGILFRTKNFSYSGSVNTEVHAFQGYYLQIGTTAVSLLKYNYSSSQLAIMSPMVDGDRAFASGRTNHVKICAVQNVITVYINGAELFSVTDEEPFLDGYCGLYTESSEASYKNLSYKVI